MRLTRRQLEASIPISMAEVRAGRDQVRAEAALDLRRLEERVEKEWTLRHALMAQNGRLSETIRLGETERLAGERRFAEIEEGTAQARNQLADARQAVAGLKAELAAARVTIALRDDVASDLHRDLETLRMQHDGQRVEIVALKTKLDSALDQIRQHVAGAEELTRAGVDRDSRLAVQSLALAQREAMLAQKELLIADLEGRLVRADVRVAELVKEGAALDVAQAELEKRLMALSDDLRKREAALAERDGKLAFSVGREVELTNEIARLKAGSRQAIADLTRTAASSQADRQPQDGQVEILKAERVRLQAELSNLKRDARSSWLAIETDNLALRAEIVKIGAAIARDAASRRTGASPGLLDLVPANDEAGLADSPLLGGLTEMEERAEAPPV